jgi:hypothetical protein
MHQSVSCTFSLHHSGTVDLVPHTMGLQAGL